MVAEPAVAIVPLPFRVAQLRGPDSEVALAAATSGLGRPPPGGVAVAWGDEGGAILSLDGDRVAVRPLAAEAIEALAAGETPRGAVAGSRRALSGPVSAYLSGATRGPDGLPGAAGLTVRERQPVAMSADPKPVPTHTETVTPGPDAVFAASPVRAAEIDGGLHLLAVKRQGAGSGLALVGRDGGGWRVRAEIPPAPGGLDAAAADFDGRGRASLALLRGTPESGRIEHWTLAGGRPALAATAPGPFAGPDDLVAAADLDGDGAADLVVPGPDRTALVLLALKGGPRERARAALPAPARAVAILGSGRTARILVALADGRLAEVRP
ncbi:VCBS repeat-containing protein [uncultured Methylobacterium sp.]|uniref:FG-GAP repeat domain-containing protein n=1 Tax=uncultured Methylobacterium sp. TaxID=157278 RepID=UPI0026060E49|nr:VCBS repeat-containing protein [uncultured Methylobacterium sp.]